MMLPTDIRALLVSQLLATVAGAIVGYMAIREDLAIIKTQIQQHEKLIEKLEQRK